MTSVPREFGKMSRVPRIKTSVPHRIGTITRVPRQFGTMTCTKGIGTATSVHVKRKVYIITGASGTKTSVPINVPQEFGTMTCVPREFGKMTSVPRIMTNAPHGIGTMTSVLE